MCWVVEKVHADFGDKRRPLHGRTGAVAVAYGRAVIAIEFGGWVLSLVSWLRNGVKTTFLWGLPTNFDSAMMTSDFHEFLRA